MKRNMNRTFYLLSFSCFLVSGLYAQENKEEARALKESRNLTYEAGEALEDDAFTLAEAKYRRAIAKSEKNIAAPYNLGNAYYGKENFSEAFMRYKDAAESAAGKAEKHKAFHNMGNVYMQRKEYEKAVEAYKEALRNEPTDEETRYNLALAKEMLEKNPPDQQQNDGDDDKKQPENDENKEKNQDQQQNQQQQNQQQQDQEKKEGDQGEEEREDNKRGEGDEKKEQQNQPQKPGEQEQQAPPRPNQLSPQQIQNLLEAMQNEERKVQEKLDAKKVKGKPATNKKDW